MNYLHKDLGSLHGGEIVEVYLNGQANVKLMSSSNYSAYKNGRRHTYYGGLATKTPVRLQVPSSGHWHVTIDLGGYAGKVRASINLLPGLLKPIKQPALKDISSLYLGNYSENVPKNNDCLKVYDVFISHASEDKDSVARPLANALIGLGLTVWYDEFELKIGDSLRRKIDNGLVHSNFGVVVISKNFISKGWTNYELDGLITRSLTGEQQLLPIWHEITKQEVLDYCPSLADKVARNTATNTIGEIAEEIAEAIISKKA